MKLTINLKFSKILKVLKFISNKYFQYNTKKFTLILIQKQTRINY
jgi:hypothetical protein